MSTTQRRARAALAILTCLLILALGLSPLPAAAGAASQSRPDFAKIDNWLKEEMAQAPIPGLAYAVVKGPEIVHVNAFGDANDSGTPFTPQTPSVVSSVSKSFTALAIRQLANAGKIDVQAPVQRYLPWFTPPGQDVSAPITIQDLLDHKSGYSRAQGDATYTLDPQYTLEDLVRKIAATDPANPVGTYDYSNFNYLVLGMVVQQVSGVPYDKYVQTNIFDPLQMNKSYNDDAAAEENGLATGHRILFGFPFGYKVPSAPAMHAAGYQISSVEDMGRYLVALLNGGKYNDTWVNVPAGAAAPKPLPANAFYDVYWNPVPGPAPKGTWWGQSGGSVNFNSDLLIAPAEGTGVMVLMNSRPDMLVPGVSAAYLAEQVMKMTLGSQPPAPSDQGFRAGWAIVDAILLLLVAFTIVQVVRLFNWRSSIRRPNVRPVLGIWLPIAIDFVLAIVLLAGVPLILRYPWDLAIEAAPDIAYTLLACGITLLVVGVIKTAIAIWGRQTQSGQTARLVTASQHR